MVWCCPWWFWWARTTQTPDVFSSVFGESVKLLIAYAPSPTHPAMNARAILLAQIQTLLRQLESAQASLKAKQIGEGLRQAAEYRFTNLINEARTDLESDKRYVEDIPDNYDLSEYWRRLTDQKEKCADLFKECLNFLGGALLRNIDRIDQLCQIADRLLFELSKRVGIEWNRSTILADG